MYKRLIIALIGLAFCVVLLFAFMSTRSGRQEGAFFAMGGIPFRVVVYDRDARKFRDDLKDVELTVDELEDIFSRYRAGSEIAKLNELGRGCMNDASSTLIDLLNRAHQWYDASGGAFDITVGPLVDLWKHAAKEQKLPTAEEVAEAKKRVGMKYVTIDDNRVCCEREGMSIDLGAIAKGAILDRAAKRLKERGVTRGLVDAGGDVSSFGPEIFSIGIQDPLKKDELLGVITVPAGGVVTSGDYERFVIIQGKRYSHIIDPRIGQPAEGLISVTVVGPDATDADALATAISVMGKQAGIALLEKLNDYQSIIVSKKNDSSLDVWCSPDLCSLFELIHR